MWYYAFSVDPINVIEDDSVCCVLWFGRVVRCCRYVPAMSLLCVSSVWLPDVVGGCAATLLRWIIRDGNGHFIRFFIINQFTNTPTIQYLQLVELRTWTMQCMFTI